MNKNDIAIIEKLSFMNRMSIAAIAKESGVSRGTVRNRINAMARQGVLIGYKARLRYYLLNMSEAIVGFDIAPESYIAAVDALKKQESVKELYTTSGDHTAIAVVVFSRDEMDSTIKRLASVEGVKNVYPAIVTEIAK